MGRYQRLLLVAKSIAREENLRREGDQAKIDKYRQIVAMESATLRTPGSSQILRGNSELSARVSTLCQSL